MLFKLIFLNKLNKVVEHVLTAEYFRLRIVEGFVQVELESDWKYCFTEFAQPFLYFQFFLFAWYFWKRNFHLLEALFQLCRWSLEFWHFTYKAFFCSFGLGFVKHFAEAHQRLIEFFNAVSELFHHFVVEVLIILLTVVQFFKADPVRDLFGVERNHFKSCLI